MTPAPPSHALDLLLVGGLTVDTFADGSTAPGGSVLHAAPAAAESGLGVGVVTSAGFEPEAEAGLSRLAAVRWLDVQRVRQSIGFEHRTLGADRQLRFLGSAGVPITLGSAPASTAILLAPVAGEVDPAAVAGHHRPPMRAAILQGWLRRLAPGEVVVPLRLAEVRRPLRVALGGYDLLIASREDLRAEGDRVDDQLRALRAEMGDRAVLVVTDAAAGAWVDTAPGGGGPERWHVPVPRVVEGVATVGAGDLFAAFLVAGDRASLTRVVSDAMLAVAEQLARRR
jgi:sugar/nucleoside kinase (ribokinase family)